MQCMQHPDRKTYARGRCISCYNNIMRMMLQSGMTDAQAVAGRWLLPKVRLCKKRKHAVYQASNS